MGEDEVLLEILGSYVNNRAPKIPDAVDWEAMLALAERHTVTGILGHMVQKYRLCGDSRISQILRQAALSTTVRFARREALRRELTCAWNRAGIRHVLMKGAVVREYYPVPELRTFGDVDVVIHPEDREKCHALMGELGFEAKVDWEPVYSYTRPPELYEVHTQLLEVDLNDRVDYRGFFSRMWEFTRPREDGALEFTPEFHFLYMIAHIAKHIRGAGAGARMYLDLAVCVQRFRDTIDWAWIRGELQKLELLRFASVALAAVERWFGVRCPMETEKVEDEVLEDFRTFTMEAGLYGKDGRDGSVSTLKREKSAGRGTRLRLVLGQVFPPVEELKARYTYLETKPWMLPVAWGHRVAVNRTKIFRRGREAGRLLSADEGEIRRLREICTRIGL